MSGRSRWPVLVVSAIGIVILCGLGIWQVQRLGEKLALIEKVEARLASPPLALSEALRRLEAGDDADYLKVTASGRFLGQASLRKIAVLKGGPGRELIHPFLTDDGLFVLVDRGVARMESPAPAPGGTVSLAGVLRRHDRSRGRFDQDNDAAANQWYWWDVPAMIAAANPPADARIMPLILHLLPQSSTTGDLFVPLPKAELRNNHLGYAITWFGLAMVLAVMTFLFLRQKGVKS